MYDEDFLVKLFNPTQSEKAHFESGLATLLKSPVIAHSLALTSEREFVQLIKLVRGGKGKTSPSVRRRDMEEKRRKLGKAVYLSEIRRDRLFLGKYDCLDRCTLEDL